MARAADRGGANDASHGAQARTPLRVEVAWFAGAVLATALLSMAIFAAIMTRLPF